jgi:hypothetical protein
MLAVGTKIFSFVGSLISFIGFISFKGNHSTSGLSSAKFLFKEKRSWVLMITGSFVYKNDYNSFLSPNDPIYYFVTFNPITY